MDETECERASARLRFRELPGRTKFVIVATMLLFVVPLAFELLANDHGRLLFALSAADTFYYLTVARNAAASGLVSFDGAHATNGFHPAWQAITIVAAILVRLMQGSPLWLLVAALVLGVVIVAWGIRWLAFAMLGERNELTPAFALLPAGVLLCAEHPIFRYGWQAVPRMSASLWGAVNGMETASVIASYAACAFLYVRGSRDRRGAVVFGLALGFLALARLDHALFSVCIVLGLLAFEPKHFRFGLTALAVFSAVLGGYMLLNQAYFGMPLPVSGAIKSTFPRTTETNLVLLQTLVREPKRLPMSHAQRGIQLFLPAAVLAFYALGSLSVRAWRLFRPGSTPRTVRVRRMDGFLLASSAGAVLLCAYNCFFVPKLQQGHWYFPVSNLLVSLIVVDAFQKASHRSRSSTSWPVALAVIGFIALGSIVCFATARPVANAGANLADFYFREAPKIREFYAAQPVKMLEFDDGILTFSTGIPAMSGMGLAIDPGAIEAAGGIGRHRTNRVSLLDLAVRRGYDRFATVAYEHGRVSAESSTGQIRSAFFHLVEQQARSCRFRTDYLSSDQSFSIIQVICPSKR